MRCYYMLKNIICKGSFCLCAKLKTNLFTSAGGIFLYSFSSNISAMRFEAKPSPYGFEARLMAS